MNDVKSPSIIDVSLFDPYDEPVVRARLTIGLDDGRRFVVELDVDDLSCVCDDYSNGADTNGEPVDPDEPAVVGLLGVIWKEPEA